MGSILDIVEEFFASNDWSYHKREDDTVLSMGVLGKNGKWSCFAQAKEDQEQFVFYSVCPVAPTEEYADKIDAVAEFVTRANYGLIIGNFELDYQDGEIRYKTSIDVEHDRLSRALLEQLVFANLTIMDRYLPGFFAVLFGDVDPETAILQVESPEMAAGFSMSLNEGLET